MDRSPFKPDRRDVELLKRQIAQLEALPHAVPETGTDLTTSLGHLVERIIQGRQKRNEVFFGIDHLFDDVSWDLLLHLYRAHAVHRRVTATCLAEEIGAALTTVLRYLKALTRAGLVVREPDWQDRRRCFLLLTERGRTLMERCLLNLTI